MSGSTWDEDGPKRHKSRRRNATYETTLLLLHTITNRLAATWFLVNKQLPPTALKVSTSPLNSKIIFILSKTCSVLESWRATRFERETELLVDARRQCVYRILLTPVSSTLVPVYAFMSVFRNPGSAERQKFREKKKPRGINT